MKTRLDFIGLWASLPLAELRSAACALESRLLAFLDACIAAEKPGALEIAAKIRIDQQERAADPVADGVGLGRLSPPRTLISIVTDPFCPVRARGARAFSTCIPCRYSFIFMPFTRTSPDPLDRPSPGRWMFCVYRSRRNIGPTYSGEGQRSWFLGIVGVLVVTEHMEAL